MACTSSMHSCGCVYLKSERLISDAISTNTCNAMRKSITLAAVHVIWSRDSRCLPRSTTRSICLVLACRCSRYERAFSDVRSTCRHQSKAAAVMPPNVGNKAQCSGQAVRQAGRQGRWPRSFASDQWPRTDRTTGTSAVCRLDHIDSLTCLWLMLTFTTDVWQSSTHIATAYF